VINFSPTDLTDPAASTRSWRVTWRAPWLRHRSAFGPSLRSPTPANVTSSGHWFLTIPTVGRAGACSGTITGLDLPCGREVVQIDVHGEPPGSTLVTATPILDTFHALSRQEHCGIPWAY